MHISRLRTLTFASVSIALLLLAVPRPAAAQSSKAKDDADMKAVASYRLTTAGLERMTRVSRAVANEIRNDPEFREAIETDKQIDALEAKDDLSEAEQQQLEALRAKQDAFEKAHDTDDSENDAQTLDDMAAQIQKFPPLARALKSEGVSAKEYATFSLALFQAAFAAGAQKSGMLKELPAGINAENVKFVQEHEAEIKKLQEEMQSLGK